MTPLQKKLNGMTHMELVKVAADMWELLQNVNSTGWRNGVTGPSGQDEGDVRSSELMSDIHNRIEMDSKDADCVILASAVYSPEETYARLILKNLPPVKPDIQSTALDF